MTHTLVLRTDSITRQQCNNYLTCRYCIQPIIPRVLLACLEVEASETVATCVLAGLTFPNCCSKLATDLRCGKLAIDVERERDCLSTFKLFSSTMLKLSQFLWEF